MASPRFVLSSRLGGVGRRVLDVRRAAVVAEAVGYPRVHHDYLERKQERPWSADKSAKGRGFDSQKGSTMLQGRVLVAQWEKLRSRQRVTLQ